MYAAAGDRRLATKRVSHDTNLSNKGKRRAHRRMRREEKDCNMTKRASASLSSFAATGPELITTIRKQMRRLVHRRILG